jgi:phosphinothricin acetyltransferase
MEVVEFENLKAEYAHEVMDIFNYYIENSFSAYPEKRLPNEFFGKFIEMTKGYPAYTMKLKGKVIGFCFIRAYNPFPAFNRTAEISYFIHKDFSGKGLGKKSLQRLEEDARKMGISTLLASITSENIQSLEFHKRNGFIEYGRFPDIGKKFDKTFDIIWMGKKISTL